MVQDSPLIQKSELILKQFDIDAIEYLKFPTYLYRLFSFRRVSEHCAAVERDQRI